MALIGVVVDDVVVVKLLIVVVQVQRRLFAEDLWQRFMLPVAIGRELGRLGHLRLSWRKEGSRADDLYQVWLMNHHYWNSEAAAMLPVCHHLHVTTAIVPNHHLCSVNGQHE